MGVDTSCVMLLTLDIYYNMKYPYYLGDSWEKNICHTNTHSTKNIKSHTLTTSHLSGLTLVCVYSHKMELFSWLSHFAQRRLFISRTIQHVCKCALTVFVESKFYHKLREQLQPKLVFPKGWHTHCLNSNFIPVNKLFLFST